MSELKPNHSGEEQSIISTSSSPILPGEPRTSDPDGPSPDPMLQANAGLPAEIANRSLPADGPLVEWGRGEELLGPTFWEDIGFGDLQIEGSLGEDLPDTGSGLGLAEAGAFPANVRFTDIFLGEESSSKVGLGGDGMGDGLLLGDEFNPLYDLGEVPGGGGWAGLESGDGEGQWGEDERAGGSAGLQGQGVGPTNLDPQDEAQDEGRDEAETK